MKKSFLISLGVFAVLCFVAGSVTQAAVVDPNAILLLHFDGDDGSQAITDDAGHAVTVGGTFQIDNNSGGFSPTGKNLPPKFDEAGYSSGGADQLRMADSAEWALGSGGWAIDCWVLADDGFSNEQQIIGQWADDSNRWLLRINHTTPTVNFLVVDGGVVTQGTTTVTIAADTWTHIAVTHTAASANMGKIWINGVERAEVYNASGWGIPDIDAPLGVCNLETSARHIRGHIDELRITTTDFWGNAPFTPPTEAYEIPEPVTAVVLALGGLFALLRRRR